MLLRIQPTIVVLLAFVVACYSTLLVDEVTFLQDLAASSLLGELPAWQNIDAESGCTLNGITCASNPSEGNNSTNIVQINFTNDSISGVIPESIGSLDSLTELVLINTDLHSTIPTSIGGLAKLKTLRIEQQPRLNGTLPESLGSLRALITLSIRNTSISGNIPASLDTLIDLDSLLLDHNQLTGHLPELQLKLTTFSVSNNNIECGPFFTILATNCDVSYNKLQSCAASFPSNCITTQTPIVTEAPTQEADTPVYGTTIAPTSAPPIAPTTATPTQQPTTATPTQQPTTVPPTQRPTTVTPTTVAPTQQPTTIAPTQQPTTVTPTQQPTTQTTAPPTKAATTVAPSIAPTKQATTPSSPPSVAPTTIAPSGKKDQLLTLGAIVGGILVLLTILYAVFYCQQKRKRDKDDALYAEMQEATGMLHEEVEDDTTYVELDSSLNAGSIRDRLTIDFEELDAGEEIGNGSFGVVKKGTWRAKEVALKFCLNISEEDDFVAEVTKMMSCTPHKNILRIYGLATKHSVIHVLILEYMPGSSLDKLLYGNALNIKQKDEIVLGISKGLEHLHSLQIVHRALMAHNMLLDKNMVPKISDYGLSRVLDPAQDSTDSIRWLSPEAIEHFFTTKSDIWNFGCLLYEVYMEKEPHWEVSAQDLQQLAADITSTGYTPNVDETVVPSKIRTLMKMCWEYNPESRPSIEKVCEYIEEDKVESVDDLHTDMMASLMSL